MQSMNHEEAIKRGSVEKYLLNELAPSERDEFEEHFFDCPDCAADVRATAAFLEAARKQLKTGPDSKRIVEAVAPWYTSLWTAKLIAPVFALMLLVIGYQNLVIFPRHSLRATSLDGPEVLTSVSLISANSRGDTIPTVTLREGQPLLLSLDIPSSEGFSSYSCELVSQSGTVLWQLPVAAQQAKDTLFIRVPAAQWVPGTYSVMVHGISDKVGSAPEEVARYRLDLRRY
jgi:hypothetical protein